MVNLILKHVWPITSLFMLGYASSVTATHMDAAHLLWVFIWAANCAIYIPVIKTKKS